MESGREDASHSQGGQVNKVRNNLWPNVLSAAPRSGGQPNLLRDQSSRGCVPPLSLPPSSYVAWRVCTGHGSHSRLSLNFGEATRSGVISSTAVVIRLCAASTVASSLDESEQCQLFKKKKMSILNTVTYNLIKQIYAMDWLNTFLPASPRHPIEFDVRTHVRTYVCTV